MYPPSREKYKTCCYPNRYNILIFGNGCYQDMNFALERYKEQIIVNEAFRNSLAEELISNHISEGTILLVADEILFDPGFSFTYASNGHGFPGQYHMIIIADRFDSRGGMIDLSGHYGGDTVGVPSKADNGVPAFQEAGVGIKAAGRGRPGHTGNIGGTGGNGMNIKVFCDRLVSIQITSNGGNGGIGGQGGEGGNGGKGGQFVTTIGSPPKLITKTMPNGGAGKGGRGGPGGPGGNGGKIELFYSDHSRFPSDPEPSIHLVSSGGRGGGPGPVGRAGSGRPPFEAGEAGSPGAVGSPSTPDVKKVESAELWERVSIELGLSP